MTSDVRLNLIYGRNLVQLDSRMTSNHLDRIPQDLRILLGDSYPPRAPDMPPRLCLQVLRHDGGEDDHLRGQVVQDLPIAEIQAICDMLGNPDEVLVRVEQLHSRRRVARVDLVVPRHGPLVVGIVALPAVARAGIILVLGLLDGAYCQGGLERLADAHDGDGLDEGFAKTAHEGLTLFWFLILGLAAEVEIQLRRRLGVGPGDDAGYGDDVPSLRPYLGLLDVCLDLSE